jgi:hypothetical protein
MIPQIRVLDSLDNDIDGIATTQTPASEYLTLDGVLASADGTVTLTTAQRITVASAGDDSGITFIIDGENESGVPKIVNLAGADTGNATTDIYLKKINSVYCDGNADAAVTVGVLAANGGVSSMIVVNNRAVATFNIGMGLAITGTLNATVQHCADEVFDTSINPTWNNCVGLTAITANDVGNIAFAVRGVRLKLNTWTSGTATLNFVQAG